MRERFPRTRKNSSGYALDAWLASGDLLDLVIGAEGTLGFVTAVEWRLDPRPAARAGLRVALRSLDVLADAVTALLAHEPSAVELLDRTFLELVGEAGPEAVLLVEIERDDQAAARAAVDDAAAAVALWAAGRRYRADARPRRSGSGRCATRRARSSPGCRRAGARSR